MSEENRMTPRMNEDLQAREVDSPVEYAYDTVSSIRYVIVSNENGPLVYLWAADADFAAGCEPVESAGDIAFNAAVSWGELLRECRSRNLLPTQALADLGKQSGSRAMGRVVPGSEGELPGLEALRAIAAKQ